MSDVNTVTIVGRLTRNAETRITSDGLAIVSFSIASNHNKKRGDHWEREATFVRLSVFGKRAEHLYPYLTKGRLVGIEGHLESSSIEHNGGTLSLLNVVAHKISLYGKPAAADTDADTDSEKTESVADYAKTLAYPETAGTELPDTQDFFSDENAVELSDIF